MSFNDAKCIQDFIRSKYQGGLIGISDLSEYCQVSEGKIYRILVQLSQQGIVKIIRRYHCPQGHSVSSEEFPYCSECNYSYSEDFINTLIYIKPLGVEQKSYSL